MTVAPIFLADLDDTLFQTRRKCPADIPAERLTPASWTDDGEPSGYQTPRQRNLLEWMRQGEVIPVTARSLIVTARTIVGIKGRAICANGGVMLDRDGNRDDAWHDHLKSAAIEGGTVSDAYRIIMPVLQRHGDHLRHWIVSEEALGLYIVIKHNDLTDAALTEIGRTCAALLPEGWHVHSNGNNFAILPSWLGKKHAVRRLVERIRQEEPDRNIVGIGDSRTDAAYMMECDYVMAPANSQIAGALAALVAA